LILSNNLIVEFTGDLLPLKNVIVEFRADSNKLQVVDPKVMKSLRKSQIIDFSANDCIDLKYDKNLKDGTPIMQLYGYISFICV
jgi:hypothetical protein